MWYAKGLVALAYPVTVVGVGPGSGEYLLPVAKEAVLAADVLVGGRNALALFAFLGKEQRRIGRDLDGVLEFIDAARQDRRVAVLLSGDPGFYSLLPRLRQHFGDDVEVIPGISSLQLACARLGIKWDDMAVASVHGRGLDGLSDIASAGAGTARAAVLTEPRFPPAAVCRYLLEQGSGFSQVWVFTDLGLPGETAAHASLDVMAGRQGMDNSVLILFRDDQEAIQMRGPATVGCTTSSVSVIGRNPDTLQPPGAALVRTRDTAAGQDGKNAASVIEEGAGSTDDLGDWRDVVTPGLPDKLFMQGEAAMSQEEVRALALCKAHLQRGHVVYEIGAGTGSWTVESARLVAPGTVWAVEKSPAAAALVRANLQRFGVTNVHLVEGAAPEACGGWPPADRVLIGGSGGKLERILDAAGRWLRPGGRVVITAVTPGTFSSAWQLLQDEPWLQPETVLVNLARVADRGRAQIWSGENPVFILSARLAGAGEPVGTREDSVRGQGDD